MRDFRFLSSEMQAKHPHSNNKEKVFDFKYRTRRKMDPLRFVCVVKINNISNIRVFITIQ